MTMKPGPVQTHFRQPNQLWILSGILVICGFPLANPGREASAQDRGANNPIYKLQGKWSDLVSQAEKAIPRSQKFQILNQLRHKLKASEQDKDDPKQLMALAHEYKRFRFYEEALQLFAEVANNPSSDDEFLIAANRSLGEVEFVANDNTEAAINYFNKAIAYTADDSMQRGELLGRLGAYYFIDQQVDRMLETYQRFIDLPESVKKSLPDSNLKANLYSGRFSADPDRAAEFLEEARKIAKNNPDTFPVGMLISIFSEQNDQQQWNAPDRIRRLVLLVDNKDYADEPQMREVAMEVFLAYFLERKKEWKRFDQFAEQYLELLSNLEKDANEDLANSVRSLKCQTLGIHVGAAEEESRNWSKSQSRREFQSCQEQLKKMTFYFPHGIKQEELQESMTAYRAGFKLLQAGPEKK